MSNRMSLHEKLCEIMRSFGYTNQHVYFQPPNNTIMNYPCIRYQGDGGDTEYADNIPYKKKRKYMITVIDENPDSEIPDKIWELQGVSYDRDYESDNLNHFVFNITY